MSPSHIAALPLHQIRRALREPRRLRQLHYSSMLASMRSLVEPDERRFIRNYFAVTPEQVRRLEADLVGDARFVQEIEAQHSAVRGTPIRLLGTVGAQDHDRCYRLLYYAVRLQRPAVVVETGVFDGLSSAFILKALRDNDHGHLCSIDLPARTAARASTDTMPFDTLPADRDPGWIVPPALRERWTLRLGSSRDLLAAWLAELPPVGVFFHDSLHTTAHMTWEYTTVWPRLAPGGLLLSDDVFWNPTFWRFSRAMGGGRIIRGMGFMRKAA